MQTISTAWGASGLQCSNPGCASRVALYCTRRCYTDCTIYNFFSKLNLEFKNSWFWEWICEPTRKIRHKHIWFWRIQSSLWAKGLIFIFPPWFAMFYRNWGGLRHEAWKNNLWFMCTTSLNPRNHIWCKYLIVRSRSFKKRTMFAICAIYLWTKIVVEPGTLFTSKRTLSTVGGFGYKLSWFLIFGVMS